jgi:hypothetical protein
MRRLLYKALDNIQQRDKVEEDITAIMTKPPTLTEFEEGIRKCKVNSSAGMTGVSYNMLKKLPASMVKSPEGAIADYRMLEGKGHSVYNYAGGSHLDLANLQWVMDSGKPALRFAENTTGTKSYRLDGTLGRMYFSHPSNADKSSVPVALSGHHGGGEIKKGLTLTTWIKPDSEMGKSQHAGRADIIGYGARRFILALDGQKAPYTLSAKINGFQFIHPNKITPVFFSDLFMTKKFKNSDFSIELRGHNLFNVTALLFQANETGLTKSTNYSIQPRFIAVHFIFKLK